MTTNGIHFNLPLELSNPPGPPQIEAAISCTCPSCRRLKSFCADPEATTLRLPLRKELRRHVHGIIDGNGLDMTHETERSGRPYTAGLH